MSEVDALFRLLSAAPPRSAEVVKRHTLGKASVEQLAALYAVTPEQAKRVLLRALLDVESGGTTRVADADEPALADAVLGPVAPPEPLAQKLRALIAALNAHADALRAALDEAAVAFEKSPDRTRDDWLRRLAIVVVLALTAYFYWREANKPKEWQRRPLLQPSSPASTSAPP